jgi:hypothetical protein
MSLKVLLSLICLFFFSQLNAQSLVNDADLGADPANVGNVFTETIKIISDSKKIFILTNNNQQLGPGDFISLALNNNLAARAVVAKTHQDQVGIKILKIYSMAQWTQLRRDGEVQIVKGDDSLFGKKVEAPKPEETVSKIKTEEDLYSGDVLVEDDLGTFDDNKNRNIKPDNIVSVFGSYLNADEIASKGGSVRGLEVGATWAYQFADNFFVEGLYGRAQLKNFPNDSITTLSNHLVGRIKYAIKGPLYTFFLPYVGYENYSISSPDAGKGTDAVANPQEIKAVEKLKKSGGVVGVTVLRRLVPGWFVKGDFGTDRINLGFAIEF